MNTKLLLAASAVVLLLLGLACTFAPDELLRWASVPPSPLASIFIQLLGALLLAFAVMNWTAKDSTMGGIYNRPLALGNVLHFTVGAIALAKAVVRGGLPAAVIMVAVVYAVFAVAFGMVLFGPGIRREGR